MVAAEGERGWLICMVIPLTHQSPGEGGFDSFCVHATISLVPFRLQSFAFDSRECQAGRPPSFEISS